MRPYRKKEIIEESLQKVRGVYADLEQIPAERQCELRTGCCYFKRTGLTPQLTSGEAMVAARAWKATGRKALKARDDGGCPLLVGPEGQGKCAIYADRPFACRTHFCVEAGGPYPRRDVVDLIRRLEDIDVDLGGSGPKGLVSAISSSL